MQEKDTDVTTEPAKQSVTEQTTAEPAKLGKAVEIYVNNGKVHLVTGLGKDSLLQVLSLAMLEAVKEATKKGGD